MKRAIGQTFDRLTIIEKLPTFVSKSGHSYLMWKCLCSCGKEKIIRSAKLGRTKSCGCLQKEIQKVNGRKNGGKNKGKSGDSAFKKLFWNYKKNARLANREFEFTAEEFKQITSSACYYCDGPPSNINKGTTLYGVYLYNGVDRLDNNKGYTHENSVPCCSKCNLAKRSLSLEQFLELISKIYHNRIKNHASLPI